MAPNPPKRPRGRPSNASRLEAQRGESSNPGPSQPKKRGRPRKRDAKADAKRRRTQSSIRERLGSTAGRRVSRGDGEDVDDEESERPGKRSRVSDASRRSSHGANVIGRRGIPQPNQPGLHGESRRPPQDDDEVDDRAPPPPSPPKPYVHVAPYTRRVRKSSKWTPLKDESLTAVSVALQDAQRAILQHLSSSTFRRKHASSALRQIARRIMRRVTHDPPKTNGDSFPPASMPANVGRAPLHSDGGREIELNFESVLNSKLNLERQLEPALDALEVLRREKEATEKELERDYETLRNLEASARVQVREQKRLLKKAHPLTPAPRKQAQDTKDRADSFVFSRDTATPAGGTFAGTQKDDDIHPLAVQLSDHVDKIRVNLQQTEGIMSSVTRSRAALRAVLLKYLDPKSYEQVILG